MEAPPENFAYTLLLSPDFSKPDALAVIDAKPVSPAYSQIVHTVTMPYKGDEFHHFGWNACSSALSPLTGHAFLERLSAALRYWPSFLDGARPTRSGRHIRIRAASGQCVDDPNALRHWAGRAAAPARYRGDRRRQAEEWLHRRELPWRTYVRRAVALPSLDYCR